MKQNIKKINWITLTLLLLSSLMVVAFMSKTSSVNADTVQLKASDFVSLTASPVQESNGVKIQSPAYYLKEMDSTSLYFTVNINSLSNSGGWVAFAFKPTKAQLTVTNSLDNALVVMLRQNGGISIGQSGSALTNIYYKTGFDFYNKDVSFYFDTVNSATTIKYKIGDAQIVDITNDCNLANFKISEFGGTVGKSYFATNSYNVASSDYRLIKNIGNLYMPISYTPAQIIQNPSAEYNADNRFWQGCATVEKTGNRLWAGWFTGGIKEPALGNHGIMSYSDDNGQTWLDPAFALVHTDSNVRVEDTQFWLDPSGRLWVIWCQSLGHMFDSIGMGVWAVYTDNPTDNEPVFSTPVRIADGLMRNKPMVLSTGEWLFSIYDMVDNDLAKVYISTDNGQSFSLQGAAQTTLPAEFDEHMVVELKNGNLWMLVRTNDTINGTIEQFISLDKGITWVPTTLDSSIKGPSSRFYLANIPETDELIFVNHYDHQSRSKLTAYIYTSNSDGTVTKQANCLSIDSRNGLSYPDVTIEVDTLNRQNDKFHIAYDRERYGEREILYTYFTRAEITQDIYQNNSIELSRIQIVSKATKQRPISRWNDFTSTVEYMGDKDFMFGDATYIAPLKADYIKVDFTIESLGIGDNWISVGLVKDSSQKLLVGTQSQKSLVLLLRNDNGKLKVEAGASGGSTRVALNYSEYISAEGNLQIEFYKTASGKFDILINEQKYTNDNPFNDYSFDILDENGKTRVAFAAYSSAGKANEQRSWTVNSIQDSFKLQQDTNNKKIVLTVGDSITQGYGLIDAESQSYPARLQQYLGQDYHVINGGVSGATVSSKSSVPYTEQYKYSAYKTILADYIIFMLGTNDAKVTDNNYKGYYHYISEYDTIITEYKKAMPNAQIIIATSPQVFFGVMGRFSSEIMQSEIIVAQKELAKKHDAMLVDINALTKNMITYFEDNIHPNLEGADILAEYFSGYILLSQDENVKNINTIILQLKNNDIDLSCEERIKELYGFYNNLTDLQKSMLDINTTKTIFDFLNAIDKIYADKVIAIITKITLNNIDLDLVNNASIAYQQLTDNQKELVSSVQYDKLVQAQNQIKEQQPKSVVRVESLIKSINFNELSQSYVEKIRAEYEKLSVDEKKLIDSVTYNELVKAEIALENLVKNDNLASNLQEQEGRNNQVPVNAIQENTIFITILSVSIGVIVLFAVALLFIKLKGRR